MFLFKSSVQQHAAISWASAVTPQSLTDSPRTASSHDSLHTQSVPWAAVDIVFHTVFHYSLYDYCTAIVFNHMQNVT